MRKFLAEVEAGAVGPAARAVAAVFRKELKTKRGPGRPKKGDPTFGEAGPVLDALTRAQLRGLTWPEVQRMVARQFDWSSGAPAVRAWMRRQGISRADVESLAKSLEFTFSPEWKRFVANIERARRAGGVDPRTPLSAFR
jgi:hypothetical protein